MASLPLVQLSRGPAALPRSVVHHARCAGLAAAGGIAAHLAMLASGGFMAGLSVVMAAVCAPCAWKMLHSPSVRTARMLVGMSLGMAVLHGGLLLGVVPSAAHSHPGHALASTALEPSHATASLVVIGADFAAALLAASWIRRRAAVG